MNNKTFIKTGVIGHPIAHTKSPLIHGYWIETYGLQGCYEAIDVPCETLPSHVRGLVDRGYAGFNVTVPHKEMIFDLCDEVDGLAREVGAVNTVVIDDSKLLGTNTDVFGFVQNIKSTAPDFDFTAGRAVVLGAGGAARAVIKGLIDEGVPKILLLNRTREKAETLAQTPNIEVGDWHERSTLLEGANLLVNTTSLGMDGKPALDMNLNALPQTALVNDIVYAPLYTDLLSQARDQGNPIVTGIGMLLHQARPSFERWFGILPTVDEALQDLVLR